MADVHGGFHRMRMPEWTIKCFCYPSVKAGSVGMDGQIIEVVTLKIAIGEQIGAFWGSLKGASASSHS